LATAAPEPAVPESVMVEKIVGEQNLAYLGPVDIARLLDLRCLDEWPIVATRRGLALFRSGRWQEDLDRLLPTNISRKEAERRAQQKAREGRDKRLGIG
jgi:hypothetical protein